MNNNYQEFTNLKAWHLAHQLMLDTYKFIKSLPKEEKFNRISQLMRSSSSIPANIAEGYGRYYYKENIAFCRKARGSLTETKNHLMAARDLKQAPEELCNQLIKQCNEVAKTIN